MLWDLWTAPHTSIPFLGMIITWMEVDSDTRDWRIRCEVAALHEILGKHSGVNLGRYFLLFLDRVGITSKEHHKASHSLDLYGRP